MTYAYVAETIIVLRFLCFCDVHRAYSDHACSFLAIGSETPRTASPRHERSGWLARALFVCRDQLGEETNESTGRFATNSLALHPEKSSTRAVPRAGERAGHVPLCHEPAGGGRWRRSLIPMSTTGDAPSPIPCAALPRPNYNLDYNPRSF